MIGKRIYILVIFTGLFFNLKIIYAQQEGEKKEESFEELYEHPLKGKEAFIFKRDIFELSLNPRLQVQAAPFVGDDSLIENKDVATNEGFRIRRAKIGLYAGIDKKLRMNLGVYLYDKESGGNILVDANIVYRAFSYLNFAIGTAPLPFSAGSIVSSSKIQFIERSFATEEMTPKSQLGFTLFGQLRGGIFEYNAGIFNGYEGYSKGDIGKGFLYSARLQFCPFGSMDPEESDYENSPLRLVLGGDYYYNDDSSIITHGTSADLQLKWRGFSFKGEFLYDWRRPLEKPTLPTTLPDKTKRMGFYFQSGYFIIKQLFEIAARFEWFDNNIDINDTGDIYLVTGGLNLFLMKGYLKTQLNYIHRDERNVPELKNDIILLQWQVNL